MDRKRSRAPRNFRFGSRPPGSGPGPREAGEGESELTSAEQREAVEIILSRLAPKDLLFTADVPALGKPWSVYRFWNGGELYHVIVRYQESPEVGEIAELYFFDEPKVTLAGVKKFLYSKAPS